MAEHPILPAGYNADTINDDELNGSGTNWPIWPTFFDSFVPMEILIVTPPMMDVFGKECPDLVIPHEEWIQLFPLHEFPLELKGPWPSIVIPDQAETIVMKGVDDTLIIQGRSPTWGASPQSKGQRVMAGGNTRVIS